MTSGGTERGRGTRGGSIERGYAPVSAFAPAGLAMFATMATIVSDDGVA